MDVIALLMGLCFSLMWSSAFATGRIIVEDASPLLVLALRFLISGLIAVAIARARGQSWRLSRPVAKSVLIFGLCQNALYLGLNFEALRWIEGSLASVIASSMPLLVALIGFAMGERLPRLGIAGLVAGFAGVALIMYSRITHGADPTGVVLCVIGATALAFATRLVKAVSAGGNLLMVIGLQMLVGSAILAVVAMVAETPRLNLTGQLALTLSYQILVPGLLATFLWFSLVGRVGAVRASTFHFLNPFFGVAVAAALLGERITPVDILGVMIAMAGILAVQMSRQAAVRAAS
ncbi:EamA family transporter [bacterium]|nr:EamA family transporter [bacterium]